MPGRLAFIFPASPTYPQYPENLRKASCKEVVADFRGGQISSDAGLLTVIDLDRRLGWTAQIAETLHSRPGGRQDRARPGSPLLPAPFDGPLSLRIVAEETEPARHHGGRVRRSCFLTHRLTRARNTGRKGPEVSLQSGVCHGALAAVCAMTRPSSSSPTTRATPSSTSPGCGSVAASEMERRGRCPMRPDVSLLRFVRGGSLCPSRCLSDGAGTNVFSPFTTHACLPCPIRSHLPFDNARPRAYRSVSWNP